MNLIAMHGLRCEPSGTFDRQAWAAKLVLLAEDVATIPADLLERVLQKQAVASPYLPKASDIFTAAKAEITARNASGDSKQRCIDDRNAWLDSQPPHPHGLDCRWILEHGSSRMVALADFRKTSQPEHSA
jgi:hypothetical protein